MDVLIVFVCRKKQSRFLIEKAKARKTEKTETQEYQASYRLLMQRRIEKNKEADDDEQDEEQKENDKSMNVEQVVSSIRNLDGEGQDDDRIYF